MKTSIADAYQTTWRFTAPRKCREMHEAGVFNPKSEQYVDLGVFEVYEAASIAKGDVFVSEMLIDGLVPIGGDSSGDAWCFDARTRLHGTTPVLACPHDGGGATYVAPSFAGFVYRLVLENLLHAHIFEDKGIDRAALVRLTKNNLGILAPWLLPRWIRRALTTLEGAWPTFKTFDAFMHEDRAFARLPRDELDHFR